MMLRQSPNKRFAAGKTLKSAEFISVDLSEIERAPMEPAPWENWRMPSDAVASLWMDEGKKLKQEK